MPVLAHVPNGKVTALWGTAVLVAPDGTERPLKVGDVVHQGDRIVTSQDGIVQISPDADQLTVAATDAAVPASAPAATVIAQGEEPLEFEAPAAGLAGGDGSMTPGLRVERVTESVTPAALDTTGTAPGVLDAVAAADAAEPAPQPAQQVANAAPTAASASVTTAEDTPVSGVVVATDSNGDALSYAVGQAPANGSVTVDAAGRWTYVPAADYSGPDRFTLTVSDGRGGSTTATIEVAVTPVADRPEGADVARTLAEDTTYTVSAADFGFSDADAGDTLAAVRIDTLPSAGTLLLGGVAVAAGTLVPVADLNAGRLVFQPAADGNGSPYGSFTFSVQDSSGSFDATPNTFTLNVTPGNDAPVISDPGADPATGNYSVTTPEDTPVSGRVIGADVDGDTLTYTKGSDPAHGTVTVGTDGRWTYTPSANYNGPDSFTVVVSDGNGGTVTSTVNVGITPANDLPDSANVARTIAEDSSYTVTAADFAFTDADAGSSLAAVRIDTLPAAGTLLLNGTAVTAGTVVSLADIAAGNLVMQPAANANGAPYGAFTFSVQDNAGGFDASPNTFTLNITPANDAPTAGNVTVTTPEDTPVSGRVTGSDVDGDGLTYTKGSDPAHGTVTVDTDGRWTYTPTADYNGPDSFTVVVSDGNGGTVTSTVNVGVTPANDLPDSADVTRTVAEDTAYTVTAADFAFTDADAGSTLAAVRIDTLPTAGTLLLGGTAVTAGTVVSLADLTAGNLTFRPAADASGSPYGAFTFSVQDNAGGFDASPNTFTLNVTPANDAPVIADPGADPSTGNYNAFTPEDTPVSGRVIGADVDGDTLTYTKGSDPAHGTVTVGTDGRWTYTPAPDYTGADSFTVVVSDGKGGTVTSTVSIGVTGANDLPDSADVTRTTAEDTAYTVTAADFAFSDPDAGNTLAAVRIDTLPSAGTLLLGGTAIAAGTVVNLAQITAGNLTFQPAANTSGAPYGAFTFSVQDSAGGFDASPHSFTLNVTPVNDRPDSADVTRTVAEDSGYTVSAADFAFTDADAGSALAAVRIDSLPSAGTLLLGGNAVAAGTVVSLADITAGRLVLQPATDANGSPYAAFTFSVRDDAGAFDATPNTFTLNVTPANDAPTAGNVTVTTPEDTPVSGRVTGSDVDGDTLTYTKGSDPAHGTVTVGTDGRWTYTPSSNYNGPDSFTVVVSDGNGGTVTSTVNVGITPANDLPDSANVARTIAEDSSYTVTAADFAFTDADAGSALAAVRIETLPTAGTLLLNGTAVTAGTVVSLADITAGNLVMQPAANANGAPYGSFTFSVRDNSGGFDASPNTFTLNVTPANDAPTTSNVTVTTPEDTPVNGRVTGSDVDGDNLTYAKGSDPAHGMVTVGTDGTWTYTPNANYNGPDSFTVAITDGQGGTVTSTVSIGVTPANDAPVISDPNANPATGNYSVTTPEDTPVSGRVIGADVDGDTLTYAKGSDPAHGTVSVGADGRWTYTPSANYNGPDSFTVVVSDGNGGTVTSTINVGITPTNDLPGSANVARTVAEDTGYTLGVADFAFTDADAASSLAAVRIDTLPTAGTLLLGGTAVTAGTVVSVADITAGRLVMQPAANATGAPYGSFTFSVQDNAGGFDASPNTFTLNVTPVNDAPTAGNYSVATPEDTPVSGRVVGNDVDGDTLTYAKGSDPAHGTVTVGTDGRWTYTPAADYTGPDSFTVTVSDGRGGSTTSTVSIGVAGDNDLPDSANVTRTTAEDTAYTVTVGDFAFTDADAGSTLAAVRIDTLPSAGTLLLGGTAVTAGAVVSVADITAGRLVMQPAANASGAPYGSFTFSVQDNAGGFDASPNTFTLNVTPVNDLPNSANVTRTVAEDTPYTVSASDFAFTDVDSGSSLAAVRIDTLPTSGTLLLGGTAITAGTVVSVADITAGRLIMQPAANANGAPYGSFTFSVQDNAGGFDASPNTFTLNVTPVNDLPNSANVTRTVAEDSSYTVTAGDFAFTDVDSGSSLAAVRIDTLPTAGTLLLGGTAITAGTVVSVADITAGRLVMQPAANANGAPYGSFTFSVQDNSGGFDASPNTFTLNVTPVNDAPVISDANANPATGNYSVSTPEDTPVSGRVTASDVDGNPLSYAKGSDPAHGTVTVGTDGRWTYTPTANYNGPDSFTVVVSDGNGGTVTSTVNVGVTPANDLPDSANVARTIAEDSSYTVTAADFAFTDADAGSALAAVRIDTLPTAGTLLLNGTAVTAGTVVSLADITAGRLVMQPAANANGAPYGSFTFSVQDNAGGFDASPNTFTLNVTPVNDLPNSANVTRTVAEDSSYTVTAGDFAFTDVDSGSSLAAVRIDTLPTAGTLLLGGTAITAGTVVSVADINAGRLVLQPAANANGAPYGSFTFSVQDNSGGFDASPNTFTLNVTPVNDLPDSANVTRTTAEDTAYTVTAGDFAFTDADAGNTLAAVRIDTLPTAGTLLLGGTALTAGTVVSLAAITAGNLTFQPAANASGAPYGSFTFSARDSAGSFDATPNTFTLNVTAVNDAPVATGGAVTGTEDTAFVFSWAQFNVSDVDSAASTLGVQITTLPADGALQLWNGTAWVAVAANQTVSQAAIAAGNLRFVPDAHESGANAFSTSGTGNLRTDYASFGYRPTDGSTTGAAATLRVDITPVADAPALTTRNHTATLFTTSWETSDTGLTQAQLNPDTTSTANLSQTTLAGWTRVDTPDTYAGGTNFWELWSNGDTQQNAAGDQTAISADTGNGSNWLELNNANNAGARVQTLGIERTVTTTAGYVYDLSLDYAGRLGFGQNYTRIAVLVDGVEVASYAGTSSNSALNWETLHFSFVGTGAAQTIRIITDASEFNTNGRGAMIDDIRLVESQGALAGNAAGGSKTEIALQGYITTGLADTDGSEALTLTISGLPTGATITTAGAPNGLVVSNGSVTLSAADLASAKLQLGSSFTGDVALTVTATSTEPNGSTASTTQNLAFKVLVGAGDVGVEGSGTHTLEASTTVLSAASGLHGEYYGYNESASPGSGYNVQSGDGSVGNLDSLADATAIINLREGSTITGTGRSSSAAASDAGWVSTNVEYGVNVAVTGNLGTNATASAGATVSSGALYDFLGRTTAGNDTAQLKATSSFGRTTDSILRMVGSAYFTAGQYDFQVRGDDGFSIRIDGQVVFEFDGNQSPTTRTTTTPVTISEGLHTVEIIYWEQGGNAVLDVDYRPSGTTTWLDFSTDNLALFQSTNLPTLTELQDIIEDPTTNGQYLVRTGQEAWGGATADTITGSAGRDIIHGAAGNDTLRGGTGADRIEGGAGNDTLTGDPVGTPYADVFAWSLADAGTAGSGRAVDTITDFNTASKATGGDVLDLRDLLQGENTAGGAGNLAQYLDIDTSGSDTVIRISSGGSFASGTYAAGGEDQRIVLTGVNLRTDMGLAASATDNQVIQELLNRGKLLVDNT